MPFTHLPRRRGAIGALAGLAAAALLASPGALQARPEVSQSDMVQQGADAWNRADYPAAIAAWQGPAQAGDPRAEFNLAQAYKWGRGVTQDLTRAELLYARAAAQGNANAADEYGLLLFQRGEHKQALPYVQAAATRGNASAQYLLGIAHFNGDDVPKDWVRAYALETLAQQQGLPQAKTALTQMDSYIPLAQRQQAAALAADMATQAQSNRALATTASDLGTPQPTPATHIAAADAPLRAAPVAPAPAKAQPAPAKTRPAPPPPPAKAQPKAEAKPASKPEPKAEPKPKAAPTGDWKLQLGAFGVPGNADAQWQRVKGRPEITGHARQNVPTGKVTRLLVTGYSKEAAQAACRTLSGAGITCIAIRE